MEKVHFVSHVSCEVAELLKRAGFDWSSIGYYNKLGFFHRAVPQHDELKAPSLEVAQSWLRTRGYEVTVLADCDSIGIYFKVYIIHRDNTGYYQRYVNDAGGYSAKIFDTFSKAQEAGIEKALKEIISEKRE